MVKGLPYVPDGGPETAGRLRRNQTSRIRLKNAAWALLPFGRQPGKTPEIHSDGTPAEVSSLTVPHQPVFMVEPPSTSLTGAFLVGPSEVETHARTFFDEFVEAFHSFDGKTIAGRYLCPYLAFHTARSVQVFICADETASYFQRVVDEYRAKGCRTCQYKDLAVAQLGNDCAIATVTWALLSEDRTLIHEWRESYNLCFVGDRFMAFASTDHAA